MAYLKYIAENKNNANVIKKPGTWVHICKVRGGGGKSKLNPSFLLEFPGGSLFLRGQTPATPPR